MKTSSICVHPRSSVVAEPSQDWKLETGTATLREDSARLIRELAASRDPELEMQERPRFIFDVFMFFFVLAVSLLGWLRNLVSKIKPRQKNDHTH